MTHVRFAFQSPLTLIRQWQQRMDGARLLEVLITGFTLDLAFFEKRCVSTARGLGARITVLGDAHQVIHDPADVHHAGHSYQHSNVGCRGAFHPKLAVLVGEDDVWTAIGSGNPTTSGWGHNDELWLVLKASRRRSPAAMMDLAAWLHALPQHVAMPSWIAETVDEVAEIIAPEVADDSLPELRIIGNLDQPLIEQLPAQAVFSLRLSAPFLDAESTAVRALIKRFGPHEVIVGLQPTFGSYHGPSLADAIVPVANAEIRDLPESDRRVSHGKLVEWVTGENITALVGSPNLSYAALLASTRQGGNCELAAIFPVARSLLPEGNDVALETLRGRSTITTRAQPRLLAPVTLLGARRAEQGITIELIADTTATIIIETSPDGGPGTWQRCHVIRPEGLHPREHLTALFQAPEQSGAAVRAVVDDPSRPFITSAVFLTDTLKCLPREANSSAPRLRQQFSDVFSDEILQRRFETDLLRLLAENAAYRSQLSSDRPARRLSAKTSESDRWTLWLEGAEATIGPSLTASLFPFASAGTPARPARLQRWDVDLSGKVEDVAEDENPEDIDPISEGEESEGRAPPVVPDALHQRMRRFAVKISKGVQASPRPSLELRMLVAQIILDLLAAGVWGPDDDAWRTVLAGAVGALPPGDDELVPDRALDFLGSLAAVGVALLDQGASLYGGRAEDLVLRRTWEAVESYVALAEPELSAQYLYQPAQSYTRVAGLAGVETVIALAKESTHDPRAPILAALSEKGWDVEFHDGAWVVSSPRSTPRVMAGRVATLVGEYEKTCAVLVETNIGKCALLREGQMIAVAESGSWKVDRLRSSVSTPSSMLTDGPLRTKASPLGAPPMEIIDLAGRVGVNLEFIRLFLTHS